MSLVVPDDTIGFYGKSCGLMKPLLTVCTMLICIICIIRPQTISLRDKNSRSIFTPRQLWQYVKHPLKLSITANPSRKHNESPRIDQNAYLACRITVTQKSKGTKTVN